MNIFEYFTSPAAKYFPSFENANDEIRLLLFERRKLDCLFLRGLYITMAHPAAYAITSL